MIEGGRDEALGNKCKNTSHQISISLECALIRQEYISGVLQVKHHAMMWYKGQGRRHNIQLITDFTQV